jgi:hypothetical protein
MEDDRPEIERALMQFRSALIDALADMDIHIAALEAACLETGSLTEEKLRRLKEKFRTTRERYRERLAHRIPLPHELRD